MTELTGRHPATRAIMRWFDADHLSPDLQAVVLPFSELAEEITEMIADGPELTVCLRKLLEAKDCAVRAAIHARLQKLG